MPHGATPRARDRAAGIAALSLFLGAGSALAQTDPRPGFNLFSVDQDVEIGRQSAAEVERQLPVVRDASLERYLNAVVQRLAAHAPGARYPYQAKLVDSPEINAFSLPGGFLYVNRGPPDNWAVHEADRGYVVTWELPDGHVLYVLLVAPRDDAASLRPVFERMLESLRVNDRMPHR